MTAAAMAWTLFRLSQLPDVQTKLRTELLAVTTSSPTAEQLDALPYLDAVVRESLRLDAPVPITLRVAKQDDVLPLSKPITDKHGKIHESLQCVSNAHVDPYRITNSHLCTASRKALISESLFWPLIAVRPSGAQIRRNSNQKDGFRRSHKRPIRFQVFGGIRYRSLVDLGLVLPIVSASQSKSLILILVQLSHLCIE